MFPVLLLGPPNLLWAISLLVETSKDRFSFKELWKVAWSQLQSAKILVYFINIYIIYALYNSIYK